MGDQPICQIITPVGMMGYGFDETLTHYELAHLVPNGIPTAIILDSGSTDSGPQKLALGSMSCPRSAYAKDLSKLLRLVHTFRVPLIFSSAGGDGTDEHVQVMEDVVREIASEEQNKDYRFKTISLYSSISKTVILDRLQQGRVKGCGSYVAPATSKEVEESHRVVAQMGSEPFVDAMDAHPDFNVIVGGRAYDPSPYVAFCVHQLKRQVSNLSTEDLQSRLGGFLHMGKIMECGGQCSLPKSHGAVSTIFASGRFEVRPTAAGSICTPLSVAAHVLYENTRPDVLRGPGGALYLEDTRYEQLPDGRTVRVSGSRFQSSKSQGQPYQLKLEAARMVGYRAMFMGGVRDRILISQIDKVLPLVKAYVAQQHADVSGEWNLDFHVYGKGHDGVVTSSGLFILGEALAPTQKLANSIASKARVAMIHAPYPGQKATAGNFGFGLGGLMEIELGPCAEFSLYHLIDLNPGEEGLGSLEEATERQRGDSTSLLRSSFSIIGSGKPSSSTRDFRATIASLRDTLPVPTPPKEARNTSKVSLTPPESQGPKTLSDLCRILRSKNAGPYEITIDAIFPTETDYQYIKRSNILSRQRVAEALAVPEEDIIWMGFFDPARAFKVTIPRVRSGKKKSAGGFMENDVHGSQEHLGLADLKLPEAAGSSATASVFGVPIWSRVGGTLAVAIGSMTVLTLARRLVSSGR